MIKGVVLLLITTFACAEVVISQANMKQINIITKPVTISNNKTVGPFIGTVDYDDTKSTNYVLPTDGVILKIYKTSGDSVKKGDVICIISSGELYSNALELKDSKNKLAILEDNAKKDEMLYRDGIISLREYQRSMFEASMLSARVAELNNRLSDSGIFASDNGTLLVKAKANGILSLAPKQGSQKIDPFVPYLRISNQDSLIAYIKIPPSQLDVIKKGAFVTDNSNNQVGLLVGISKNVDGTTNSASAVAKITSHKDSFIPGTSSEFFISTQSGEKTVMLPKNSVSKYKNDNVCFVKVQNGFEMKKVIIMKETKDGVYIKNSDINEGSEVAISGITNLKGAVSGMGFE